MKEKKENLLVIVKFVIIVFAISLYACKQYLNNVLLYAHDIGYHLNRITEISNAINLREFPVIIHSNLVNSMGYANSIFYPELFLIFPAILINILKISTLNAYKIFLVVVTFFTFVSMYISTKGIFKKKEIAWISSILYVFSLYRLVDIYVRGAVGEVLSFVFFPLIIYGLYEIIFDSNKKWYIISIGLWGLANSHVLSFLISLPIIILICILNIDKILKNKKVLFNLIKAAILAIVLCIGFFGPMLEQKMNDTFNVDKKIVINDDRLERRATSLSQVFETTIKSGDSVDAKVSLNGLSQGIGVILLILSGLIFFRKITYKENRFEIQLYILSLFVYIFSTSLMPWEKLSIFSIIQFPFRLNIISTVGLCLISAISFYDIVEQKRDFCILLCIMILVISGFNLDMVNINVKPEEVTKYEDLVDYIGGQIGLGEYLPINTDINDLQLYNINDTSNLIEFERIGSKITFNYERKDLKMEINIPFIYYKGYKAWIEDDDGNKTDLIVEKGNNGHVLIKGDSNYAGKITVEYKHTIIQIISYTLSTITLIATIIYSIKIKYLKDNLKNK